MNHALETAIIIATVAIIAGYLVIAWEMDHDTKPRDPYQR